MKHLPHVDMLKVVGNEKAAIICTKSGWRGVSYIEKKGAKKKYYCLYCKKWVKDGKEHKLIDYVTEMNIMGPKGSEA